MALQWAYENISYFGGNASNITLAGYSAGSHSVFHQLAYDLGMQSNKAIVKRAMMLSNGPGVQPKTLEEAQDQYSQLLAAVDIPASLPPRDQLLRSLKTFTPILLASGLLRTSHMQTDKTLQATHRNIQIWYKPRERKKEHGNMMSVKFSANTPTENARKMRTD
jgi:carboxylesterase type B